MSVRFDIDTRGLNRALTRYAVTRRKSDADVVNKAMRYVLPAAAKRVKDKSKGPNKVARDLRAKARNPIASNFRRQKGTWDGTLAAAIIASRLKARGKLSKKITPNFRELVDTFAAAKIRSANFLRAGFIPSFRQFSVPNKGVVGQRYFKGRSRGIKARPSLMGIAEAFATNQREGAYIIAPHAFHAAVRDVRKLFLGWLREDVRRDAIRSGFY